MNYQQVKQFLTIVKYMNLSKAASELYISQPALSLALGRLESELGVKLFYRDGKKLIISPAGEKLHEHFKELKNAHDRLTQEADDIRKHDTEQYVTIGFSLSAMFFATLYMNGLLNSWKNITIKKIFADTQQLTMMLKNGMIDFAVTCPPLRDDRLSNRSIFTERYMLAVSSGHPLASHDSISLKDLEGVGLTGLKKHQPTRKLNDDLCEQNHFVPTYLHEYDYPEYYGAVARCAHGDQFANFILEDFFERCYGDGYKMIPFEPDNMTRSTELSWLTERKLDLEYKDFLDYLTESLVSQHDYHIQFSEILSKTF